MKQIPILLILIILHLNLNASHTPFNDKYIYKIENIDSTKQCYIIDATNNGELYKIISYKNSSNGKDKIIEPGREYTLDLYQILPAEILFGMPVSPKLGTVLDIGDNTVLKPEHKYGYKIFMANNLNGLSLKQDNYEFVKDEDFIYNIPTEYTKNKEIKFHDYVINIIQKDKSKISGTKTPSYINDIILIKIKTDSSLTTKIIDISLFKDYFKDFDLNNIEFKSCYPIIISNFKIIFKITVEFINSSKTKSFTYTIDKLNGKASISEI